MEFKYAEEHSLLSCECPPIDKLEQKDITGYRWVHEDLSHPNDTLPPYKRIPLRIKDSSTCEDKCGNYALSFFDTENNAEIGLKRLLKKRPLLSEVFGDCIAACQLRSTDGMISKPNKKTGHFNLHESKDVNLQPRLKLKNKVIT